MNTLVRLKTGALTTWAQHLKRIVGSITRPACGETMRIVAGIEDPAVIEKIPTYRDTKAA